MLPSSHPSASVRATHTKQWWGVACTYLAGIAGTCIVLYSAGSISTAVRWSVGAAVGLCYLLFFLRRHLVAPLARKAQHMAGSLGLPNAITLARGGLYAGLGGCLFIPEPTGHAAWLPGSIYLGAALTDSLDGYLARRRNQSSRLGEALDVEVDGLGVLVATSLAVYYGQLPVWYLSVGGAYYVYRFVVYVLRRSGRETYPIPTSSMRRIIGGFQVGFLAVVLWPLFEPPMTTVAGIVFAVAFFASFLRDGSIATGLIAHDGSTYSTLRRLVNRWVFERLPVVLRAVVLLGAIWLVGQSLNEAGGSWQWIAEQFAVGTPILIIWLFVIIVTSLLIFLGAAGRLAAFGLLTAICADVILSGLTPPGTLLLVAALMLMLLGTGNASWCSPEDKYLTRPSGTS